MFLLLPDHVAVITGGARGIGYSIADRLGRAGARLVIADINEDGAIAAAEQLRANGYDAAPIHADVRQPEQVNALMSQTLVTFGQIDILINNAGITGRAAPLWELTDDDWNDVLAVDLTSVFYCCRAVIKHMRERRQGTIVNIASITGKEGNPNQIPYSVAKAGVICLTKALAKEVVSAGIRVIEHGINI